MEATLKVYANCSDAEPIKRFTCRRLTFGVSNAFEEKAKEIEELEKAMQDKTEEERAKITNEIYEKQVDIIKLFFPEFTREDLNGLDPYEYHDFCLEIGAKRAQILRVAQKN